MVKVLIFICCLMELYSKCMHLNEVVNPKMGLTYIVWHYPAKVINMGGWHAY